MNAGDVIAALDLPSNARVDQRVPKKLLVENGVPTAADKRRINEGIEEIRWLAALKPTTIGVPEYRDQTREYLEIAVLQVSLRSGAMSGRLAELVHRAVPYPVALIMEEAPSADLSLAHKRCSQGEGARTVLDGDVVATGVDGTLDARLLQPFLEELRLARQPRSSLYALYQGWMDAVEALHASSITGVFARPSSAEQAMARRSALKECLNLQSRVATLMAAADKETQVSRHVDLNLEVKRLEAAYDLARASL